MLGLIVPCSSLWYLVVSCAVFSYLVVLCNVFNYLVVAIKVPCSSLRRLEGSQKHHLNVYWYLLPSVSTGSYQTSQGTTRYYKELQGTFKPSKCLKTLQGTTRYFYSCYKVVQNSTRNYKVLLNQVQSS